MKQCLPALHRRPAANAEVIPCSLSHPAHSSPSFLFISICLCCNFAVHRYLHVTVCTCTEALTTEWNRFVSGCLRCYVGIAGNSYWDSSSLSYEKFKPMTAFFLQRLMFIRARKTQKEALIWLYPNTELTRTQANTHHAFHQRRYNITREVVFDPHPTHHQSNVLQTRQKNQKGSERSLTISHPQTIQTDVQNDIRRHHQHAPGCK